MTNGNGQYATLDDLAAETLLDVKLTRPDGRALTVQMRALSEDETWKLREAFKWPEPPSELGRWDGPDRPVRKRFNTEDPAYLKAQGAASRKFSRQLLAHALVMDIPGATEEDRAAELERRLPAWASGQLTSKLNQLLGISDAEVDIAAANFPSATSPSTAS